MWKKFNIPARFRLRPVPPHATRNLQMAECFSGSYALKIFFSYNTIIAVTRGAQVYVTPLKYSVSTSKHTTWVRRYLSMSDCMQNGQIQRFQEIYCDWETFKAAANSVAEEFIFMRWRYPHNIYLGRDYSRLFFILSHNLFLEFMGLVNFFLLSVVFAAL